MNFLSERLPHPVSLGYLRPNLSERFVGFIILTGEENKKRLYIRDMKLKAMCEIAFDGDDFLHQYINKFEWGCQNHEDDIFLLFDQDSVRPCFLYRYSLDPERLFRKGRIRVMSVPKRKMEEVFIEEDPASFVDVYRSKDSKYIMISSNTKICSTVFVVSPLRNSDGKTKLHMFCTKEDGLQLYVTHTSNYFYMVSNLRQSTVPRGTVASESEPKSNELHQFMSLFRCKGNLLHLGSNSPVTVTSDWDPVWPSAQKSNNVDDILNPFGLDGICDLSVEDIDFFSDSAVLYGRRNGVPTLWYVFVPKVIAPCLTILK